MPTRVSPSSPTLSPLPLTSSTPSLMVARSGVGGALELGERLPLERRLRLYGAMLVEAGDDVGRDTMRRRMR